MTMPRFRDVCKVEDIAEGKPKRFVIDDKLVGVFRIGDEFFALDDHCSHAGASLVGGFTDVDVVTCRIHHWKFSIRDGTCLDPDNPAYRVKSYPVRVVEDVVQVEI